MPLAAYIHDLDPVILQIGNAIAIRWYGLAYLAGFIIGYYLLKYLSRKQLYPIPADKLADFITWTAIFGVLLGGRLGYILFYQIPNRGIESVLSDPLSIVRVWEGGMASHGGILGVLAFTLFYSIRHKTNWIAITDGLAIVAPVGLFFGRMANFINGELYGRIVSPGSGSGMKFPAELYESVHLRYEALQKIYDDCPDHILRSLEQSQALPVVADQHAAAWMVERVRDTPAIRDIVGSVLPERYPSQLYEGAAEGLLLFAVLWFVRVKFPNALTGTFCAIFCLLYAAGRITVENFREPDSPVWLSMTRGQFLSIFLIFMGFAFLAYAFRHKKTVRQDTPTPEKAES